MTSSPFTIGALLTISARRAWRQSPLRVRELLVGEVLVEALPHSDTHTMPALKDTAARPRSPLASPAPLLHPRPEPPLARRHHRRARLPLDRHTPHIPRLLLCLCPEPPLAVLAHRVARHFAATLVHRRLRRSGTALARHHHRRASRARSRPSTSTSCRG
ncbi:Os01g0288600 [Oryza sativa Japonica Group]|uniref:Os01g0288600 protein n=2 Tax=Oryza sativa subsp. japonica TaxID=39947 RepID=B9EVM2_ORYSJ|nr:hypothetical protein OsJ_01379 [Oryza sativa Japonica Group]BAS71641.1 Os01g0288600 [Oryza sativa Japonica Group]